MAEKSEGVRRSWPSSFSRQRPENDATADHGQPPRWAMGILNDKETIQVPGSVLLLATDHKAPLLRNTSARMSRLSMPVDLRPLEESVTDHKEDRKEDRKKMTSDGNIILEPQPEDSANDPLNWPAWRRDMALLALGVFSMLGGGMTPVLAASFTNVSQDYGVSITRVSLTTGLYMLGLGLGSVIFSPTAILWGKRPVYLIGAILFVLASVWCALSANFASLILARIFQGLAVSPVECLPSATIAEIFFLHERAFRIGIYTLLLLGGKNLVPLVSAAISQRLGWRWVFWIVSMTVCSCTMLVFLFVPESFWDRCVPRLDQSSPNNVEAGLPSARSAAPTFAERGPGRRDSRRDTDRERQSLSEQYGPQAYTRALRDQPPRTFIQQLKPFPGRLSNAKWHKVALRPLILFSYPAVLWSSVVYACSLGWLIVISESVAMIYRDRETYNFNTLQTGLVYLSPFIGGVFGSAVAGRASDMIVRAMAGRNGGLYEPEFRLVMTLPIALTTVVGLMGFGWSAQNRDSWIVPTVFFGIVSFGCCLGSTTSITYCVDSYRQYAGEALVTLNFSKNVLHGLVFSLFITSWIKTDGTKSAFIWIGVIQLLCLMSTVPMYIFGKRARMWTTRKNLMEKF